MSGSGIKRELEKLRRRDGLRAATAVILDYLPIAAVIFLLARHPGHWGLYLLGWLVLGVQYHRLALLGHDGAHYLLFSSRRLNDLVTNLLLFNPLGITAAGYRAWHFDHHRHQGTPADPEKETKRGWRYAMPKTRAQFALMFAADCLGLGADEILRVQLACRPRSLRDALRLLSYWSALGSLAVIAGRIDLLVLHLATNLSLLMALSRLRMWCEHSALAATHRIETSPLLAYVVFPHDTWLHYEHHRWPSIPFYNLRKARALDRLEPVQSFPAMLADFDRRPSEVETDSPTPAGGAIDRKAVTA